MNKYLILLIILVIIVYHYNYFEPFLPSNYDNSDPEGEGRDYVQFNQTSPYVGASPSVGTSPFVGRSPSSNKCCLVEKTFIYDPSSQNNGKFSYVYKKINYPEYCKNNLHDLKINKSNLFVEGDILYLDENNLFGEDSKTLYNTNDSNKNNIIWKNEMCEENKSPLGSCRFANKECIEFITQDSCNKLKMEWSEKTCQDPIPYKFIDKVKFKLPEQKYELVQMFPS